MEFKVDKKFEKTIYTDKDSYLVVVHVSDIHISNFENIEVAIKGVNGEYVYHTNTVKKENGNENRYLEAIRETIQEFQDDNAIQKLLDWDGELKYKLSL